MGKQPRKMIEEANEFYSSIKDISATFSQHLQTQRRALELSQKDLAKKVGVSTNTIQSYENGALPRGIHFIALARALKCSINWLINMNEAEECRLHQYLTADHLTLFSSSCSGSDYLFQPEFINDESKGVNPRRALSFNYEWLMAASSHPKNVRLFIFRGPSMKPALHDNDLVVIDLGQTYFYTGYLYLIKIDDCYSINRLLSKPGQYVSIVSDNRKMCQPFELPQAEVEIIGRVIWVSRSL